MSNSTESTAGDKQPHYRLQSTKRPREEENTRNNNNNNNNHTRRTAPSQRYSSARETFLLQLENFPKDDDDENNHHNNHNNEGVHHNNHSPSLLEEEETFSGVLFGHPGPSPSDRGHQSSKATTKRVGIHLLMGMQNHTNNNNNNNNTSSFSSSSSNTNLLKKVEAYAPLSTGSFMESQAQHGRTIEEEKAQQEWMIQTLKVGDVVCKNNNNNNNNNGTNPKNINKNNNNNNNNSSPETTEEGEEKKPIIKKRKFKSMNELTEEEKLYGRKVHVEWMEQLGEVSRVDRDANTVEVLFLSPHGIPDRREKLTFRAIRPAGFKDRELFLQWKRKPETRPLRSIGGGESTSTHNNNNNNTVINNPAGVEALPWWVLPRLAVRIRVEDAVQGPTTAVQDQYNGRKAVVLSFSKQNNTIKVKLLPDESSAASPTPATHKEEVIEIKGIEWVETVLPKKGQRGIVVLDTHPYSDTLVKGTMVVVVGRVKSAETGEFVAVEVKKLNDTTEGNTFKIPPEALCLFLYGREEIMVTIDVVVNFVNALLLRNGCCLTLITTKLVRAYFYL